MPVWCRDKATYQAAVVTGQGHTITVGAVRKGGGEWELHIIDIVIALTLAACCASISVPWPGEVYQAYLLEGGA